MTTQQRIRLITIAAICLLFLILILQNTRVVETRLLFMTTSMPTALLLMITFVAGFVSGSLFGSSLLRRPDRKEVKDKS
jgi:uncharacterized integral membrane protein